VCIPVHAARDIQNKRFSKNGSFDIVCNADMRVKHSLRLKFCTRAIAWTERMVNMATGRIFSLMALAHGFGRSMNIIDKTLKYDSQKN